MRPRASRFIPSGYWAVSGSSRLHYLLNVAYGVVIVSAVHATARAASVVIALVFGFVMIEIVFAMAAVVLSSVALGTPAWVGVFGGSLIGTATALIVLSRRYPLAARLRQAEEET